MMAACLLLAAFTAASGHSTHDHIRKGIKSSSPKAEDPEPTAAVSPDPLDAYRKMIQETTAELGAYETLIKTEAEGLKGKEDATANKDRGWIPQTARQYLEKDAFDLATNPTTLIVLAIGLALFCFRKKIGNLFSSLQSFRLGPVEIVRAAIEEIKSEFIEGPSLLRFPVGANSSLTLADFADYPTRMETLRFRELFFDLDRQSAAYRQLVVLEARLALQEDRLRSSSHFDENEPPWKFAEAKSKLFTLYVSIGNIYGFARLQPGSDLADVDTAEYYFNKAIGLRARDKNNPGNIAGYTHFCIASTKGGCGLRANPQTALTEAYMDAALKELGEAEKAGHKPSYQYHLKAMLLMERGRRQEAALAWELAANLYKPPSWKMHFNRACALARLTLYRQALNELEKTVSVYNDHHFSGDPNLRDLVLSPEEGAELNPFHVATDPDWASANGATSGKRKNFTQILGLIQ